MIDKTEKAIAKVRRQKPLILCLTNFITMEFVVNDLLAFGAAPIMSACEDAIEELVKMASALYVNIGTLNQNFIRPAKKAIEIFKKHNKTIIFDPIGRCATTIRAEIFESIFCLAKFIRSNSSEIVSLADHTRATY